MSEKIKIPKKKRELAVRKEAGNSVETLISQAIAGNVPVETLERLFTFREKVKAETAKKKFVKDLAGFQSKCKTIEKTKIVKNKDGLTTQYKYAPLDAIVDQIKENLGNYGFSYTWNVINETGFITAIAKVTHRLGHSETSEFKVPVALSEYMTAPQSYAAALTFAKRYSLINALGISTGDEDTDATTVGKEKTAKSPKSQMVFLLKALGFDADTKTKALIEPRIKELTQLDPTEEKNHGGIVERLTILVREKEEANEDIKL